MKKWAWYTSTKLTHIQIAAGKPNIQQTGSFGQFLCAGSKCGLGGRVRVGKAAQAHRSFQIHLGPILLSSSCWLLGHICFCGPSWLPPPLPWQPNFVHRHEGEINEVLRSSAGKQIAGLRRAGELSINATGWIHLRSQGSRWPEMPSNVRGGHSLKQNPPVVQGSKVAPGWLVHEHCEILSHSAKSKGRIQVGNHLSESRSLATIAKGVYRKGEYPWIDAASSFSLLPSGHFISFSGPFQEIGGEKKKTKPTSACFHNSCRKI